MSLGIFVDYCDPISKELKTAVWNAGAENYRSKLWGSPQLQSLNLRLLPRIKNGLIVPNFDFDELLQECAALEQFCQAGFPGLTAKEVAWWSKLSTSILMYVDNFRKAVAFARSVSAKELEVG
jgi:hypothetical protein